VARRVLLTDVMMWSAILAVGLVAAVSTTASAEVTPDITIRQVNTATRVIGCSGYIEACAGATSIRTGLVVVDVTAQRLRYGRIAAVGMFQGSARPDDALLASQMIAGGGARVAVGRAWIQGGVGFAATQVAPGPKTIATTRAIAHGAPALLLGVGMRASAGSVPLQLSLDLGTSIDDELAADHAGRAYQVTASFLVADL